MRSLFIRNCLDLARRRRSVAVGGTAALFLALIGIAHFCARGRSVLDAHRSAGQQHQDRCGRRACLPAGPHGGRQHRLQRESRGAGVFPLSGKNHQGLCRSRRSGEEGPDPVHDREPGSHSSRLESDRGRGSPGSDDARPGARQAALRRSGDRGEGSAAGDFRSADRGGDAQGGP